jgi:hypothetical protein
MYKNNNRFSSKIKDYSPLQLLCNLTGNRAQTAIFHTTTNNVNVSTRFYDKKAKFDLKQKQQ